MRARNTRLGIIAVSLAAGFALTGTACDTGKTNNATTLADVSRGKKVYVDVLNECGKKGDRSGLEKNKAGAWVIDRDVPVSSTKSGAYNVQVKRTGSGVEVLKLNGALLGEDGDTTVSSDQYKVTMKASLTSAKWESAADKLPAHCTGTSSTKKATSASPTPTDDKKKQAKPSPAQSSAASKDRSRQRGSNQNSQQQDTDTGTDTKKDTKSDSKSTTTKKR